jgi:hypothetical protein
MNYTSQIPKVFVNLLRLVRKLWRSYGKMRLKAEILPLSVTLPRLMPGELSVVDLAGK